MTTSVFVIFLFYTPGDVSIKLALVPGELKMKSKFHLLCLYKGLEILRFKIQLLNAEAVSND